MAQQARLLNGDPGGRARVSYQGVAHAYSDSAAQKYLAGRGLDGDLTGYRSFREAAGALLAGDADLSVLPIENTTAGSINEVYALLREHELYIVGEETLKVEHCLAALGPVPLSALTKILSHPQGLEQCAAFLQSVPNAVPTTYFDTAEALRAVSEQGDPTVAAIGSVDAAQAYGLEVLRHNISDQPDNFTRFVVLSRPGRRRRADPVQDQPHPGHPARGRRAAAVPGGPGGQRALDDQAGVPAAARPALGVPVLRGHRGQRR